MQPPGCRRAQWELSGVEVPLDGFDLSEGLFEDRLSRLNASADPAAESTHGLREVRGHGGRLDDERPRGEELFELLGLDEDALVPGVAGSHTGTCGVGVLGHGLHREEGLKEGKALHGCLLGFVRIGMP